MFTRHPLTNVNVNLQNKQLITRLTKGAQNTFLIHLSQKHDVFQDICLNVKEETYNQAIFSKIREACAKDRKSTLIAKKDIFFIPPL